MGRFVRLLVCLLVTVFCNSVARGDITTTPHALVQNVSKTDTSAICAFCHTPNLSGTPPEKAPLWQRSAGTTLTFTIYDDIGRLGLGKSSVGSQSIACLSCHDANQAISVSKGTGGDHPFGVPYRGALKNRGPNVADSVPRMMRKEEAPFVAAQKLVATEDFRDVSRAIVEDRAVWWVSSSGQSSRRTRNDLPLYERTDEATGDNVPFLECSSCHDPHSSNRKFLRVNNDEGSRLCLTCHLK